MIEAPQIGVRQLPHAAGLPLPAYATAGAAGADIEAALGELETIVLAPGQWGLIPTGLMLQIPEGFEVQLRPRSGLAAKQGVTVLNAPGTIDWDYRGEIKVILINHGPEPFSVRRGMRIAQLVVAPVVRASFVPQTALEETARGSGGFGSTGSGGGTPPSLVQQG
jgi:dUTP pyrophosphatase